jgi:ketosteroid isomerase-like protein
MESPIVRRLTAAALVIGLLGGTAALAAPAADPAPVIAAERAFSARAAEIGIGPSFLEYMTGDAIILAPDPVNAKTFYTTHDAGKAPKDGGVLLSWWPSFAGIARSGDLGFTTGPATVNGAHGVYYFTIWARQPDGGWKWVYDGGVNAESSNAPGPDKAPVILAPAVGKDTTADAAMAQVKTAETKLAASAKTNVSLAYKVAMAPDAHMQGSGQAPATTPDTVDAELSSRAVSIDFAPLGGSASKAGDLAWTYGTANWAGGRGHYVRVWQRRADGWRIVFDEVLPVRTPAAG